MNGVKAIEIDFSYLNRAYPDFDQIKQVIQNSIEHTQWLIILEDLALTHWNFR